MKHVKFIVMATAAALCAFSAFARGPDNWQGRGMPCGPNQAWERYNAPAPESVTVSGTLQLVNGQIAVVQENKTYYTMGLHHLVGFVEGFKEGAAVKLEGSAFPLPFGSDSYRLWATKLTLNGKDYNLSPR
jgi:hypothetical protein